jgi:hypothetical protein
VVQSIAAQTYSSQLLIIPAGVQESTDNNNTYSNLCVLGEHMVNSGLANSTHLMNIGFVYLANAEPVEPTPLKINNVTITDVTDTQFSVIWAVNQVATGDLKVFSDEYATDDITDNVTIVCDSCQQADAKSNGIIKINVEGLLPDTPYFFKTVTTAQVGGEVHISDTIFQVRTETESGVVNNNFIAQKIFKKGWTPGNDDDFIASGALLIVSVDGADYPVSAWVGFYGAYAGVDLSNVYSASSHKSMEIKTGTQMKLWAFGGLLGYNTTTWHHDNSDNIQIPVINEEEVVSILSHGIEVDFKQGLNVWAYPVEVPDNFSSYDLLEKLGGCDEVNKIQEYSGSWHTTTCFLGGASGSKFQITNSKGLLVYMNNPMEKVKFEGSPVDNGIDLNVGLNLVGIPSPPSDFTSGMLIEQLGAPDDVNKIQRYLDSWETTIWFLNQPSGAIFPIQNGQAYIIYMNQPKTGYRPEL